MPIAFELAAANAPEREVAAEMLARVELDGYTVLADKDFAGHAFEALMTEFGAIFRRPRPQPATPAAASPPTTAGTESTIQLLAPDKGLY